MSLKPTDYLMGVMVPLTWGMGIVVAKAAIEHFPPILLMSLRFTVTALVLVWFVRPPLGMLKRIFGIAIVGSAIQYSLTFTGLKGIDASVATLVVQLEVPFLVLLGTVFLKERPGLRKWAGIAMAFAGVGLIAGEPRLSGSLFAVMLVISGAFAWAVGQIMVRALPPIDGITMAAWVAVFAAPQLLVMSAIIETGHIAAIVSAPPLVWGAVIYLGVVMTAFGYTLWYSLIRRHPVSTVAPFLLLLPVFSVAGSIVFLGEEMTVRLTMGGIVVLTGVAFILIERGGAERPQRAGRRRISRRRARYAAALQAGRARPPE